MTAHPVRQSFNRAASLYEASARLQQQVADQFIQEIRAALPRNFTGRIVDAGCGTGYCLNQLHRFYPDATLLGVDFAEAMLTHARISDALTINSDLQHLPLGNATIDLYVSSLAWQWCNIGHALDEAIRVLKPGASLWLTTLVDGTFHEMATAFSTAALSPAAHLLAMPPETTIRVAFRNSGMQNIAARCQPVTTWHTDFSTLRHSIRGVGANRLPSTQQEPLDRAARSRLIDAYEALRTPRGLPLTYNVLTIHGQRG